VEEFKLDDQREHRGADEVETVNGNATGILDKTPIDAPSLHIHLRTLDEPHNFPKQTLIQDGLEWERKPFELTPTWRLEPSTNAVEVCYQPELFPATPFRNSKEPSTSFTLSIPMMLYT